jgi:hypothetical protein
MRKPDVDPYTVLGVPRNATSDEIKAAYRALVAKYHPDLHQGNPLAELAAARLAEINSAYEILSDPGRRAAYDAGPSWPRPTGSPWPDIGRGSNSGRKRAAWPYVIGLVLLAPLLIRVVVSLVRLLVRAIGMGAEGFAAARGTPLLLAVVLVAVGIFLFIRRRKK